MEQKTVGVVNAVVTAACTAASIWCVLRGDAGVAAANGAFAGANAVAALHNLLRI